MARGQLIMMSHSSQVGLLTAHPSGVLSFNAARDYEYQTDTDGSDEHQVTA